MSRWLRDLFSRRRFESDLQRELQAHVDAETEDNLDRGRSLEDARRDALLAFGNVTHTAELCREQRSPMLLQNFVRDLRYAARVFRKSPGFTAVAVLSLGLGIGASSAIFSVVDSVLVRPLPYADPDRLVMVRKQLKPIAPQPMPVGAPDSVEIQRSEVFAEAGTLTNRRFDVSTGTNPERVMGARISPSALRLLGVAPAQGRLFMDDEDRPGVRVAILGYDLWHRISSDSAIVGKTILVDREPYLVAGVMPRGFVFPPPGIRWEKPAEIYVPLALTPSELGVPIGDAAFGVVARLAPGVSIDQASARMDALAHGIQARFPAEILRQLPKNIELRGMVFPLKDEAVGGSRRLLFVLLSAVAALLLIACANVAGMLLSRASSRGSEIALRLALGAGRATLVRQLLTESLLFGLAGGFVGIALALIATRSSSYWLPPDVPHVREIGLNFHVLAFAFAAAIVTTFVFGIAPAMLAAQRDLEVNLRQTRLASARTARFTMAVVVVEIALTVVLQTGAALLVRSLIYARSQPSSADRVVSVSVALPANAYRDAAAVRHFYDEALRKVSAIPGVTAVAAASSLPYSEDSQHVYTVENRAGSLVVPNSSVLGDYFDALTIPLRAGRMFRTDERDGVIVNETAAKTFWPGADPIGKRIKWGVLQTPFPWLTVIGVVADAEQSSPDRPIRPQFYEPFMLSSNRAMSIVAQSPVAPSLVGPLRTALQSIDPALPLSRIQTLDRARAEALTTRRTTTQIVGSFAGAALLLAGVGIYGLMLYWVTDRRREIAIRIALGANRGSILGLVLTKGVLPTAAGFAIGLGASFALSRLVASLTYGVG
ncbi:MAG: ABC transporter permease [Acidobacteriia bacterium]|nr:ABC transporter permease [Terriglobia bacterium]